MVKPEWGTKRSCPKCATRFYDLGKDDPVTCIECGHSWTPEPILKSKQPLPFEAEKTEKDKKKAEGEDKKENDDDDLAVVDDDDDSVDDDNDLGGDDDLGVKGPEKEDDN